MGKCVATLSTGGGDALHATPFPRYSVHDHPRVWQVPPGCDFNLNYASLIFFIQDAGSTICPSKQKLVGMSAMSSVVKWKKSIPLREKTFSIYWEISTAQLISARRSGSFSAWSVLTSKDHFPLNSAIITTRVRYCPLPTLILKPFSDSVVFISHQKC